MRRLPIVAALIGAAFAPQVAGAGKPKPPRLEIAVTQSPEPARPGDAAEVTLAVSTPEGIVLNRYPGITLRIGEAHGVEAPHGEVFVGSKKPIRDEHAFYFKTPVPIRFTLVPAAGAPPLVKVPAKLSFFYCVKKSGYCAPGHQEIEIPLRVAAD